MLVDMLVGLSRRSSRVRKLPFALFSKSHRIGRPQCLENPRPKDKMPTNGQPTL